MTFLKWGKLPSQLEKRKENSKKIAELFARYSLDDVKPKKRTAYKKSELRLLESLENVCDRVLEYNIHKERKDSTRFAKGMSQTFQTLHGLVDKGVKVELGIPYELWGGSFAMLFLWRGTATDCGFFLFLFLIQDKPSVEVTNMKSQCESLLEQHEHVIESWYFNHQDSVPLIKYFCEDRALKGTESSCLYEVVAETKGETGTDDNEQSEERDELWGSSIYFAFQSQKSSDEQIKLGKSNHCGCWSHIAYFVLDKMIWKWNRFRNQSVVAKVDQTLTLYRLVISFKLLPRIRIT